MLGRDRISTDQPTVNPAVGELRRVYHVVDPCDRVFIVRVGSGKLGSCLTTESCSVLSHHVAKVAARGDCLNLRTIVLTTVCLLLGRGSAISSAKEVALEDATKH